MRCPTCNKPMPMPQEMRIELENIFLLYLDGTTTIAELRDEIENALENVASDKPMPKGRR